MPAIRLTRAGEIPDFFSLERIESGDAVSLVRERMETKCYLDTIEVGVLGVSRFKQEKKARRIGVLYLFFLLFSIFITALLFVTFAQAATFEVQNPTTTITVAGIVTAYTSSVDETDDRPWETAAGTLARDGIAACPSEYPFGTEVEIAGRVFVCEDRMNGRYRDAEHFDVWVKSKEVAFAFGRQALPVVIR